MPMLPERSLEREEFNRRAEAYGGPLRVIAATLTAWHQTHPAEGSMSAICAIMANEVAKAADLLDRAADMQFPSDPKSSAVVPDILDAFTILTTYGQLMAVNAKSSLEAMRYALAVCQMTPPASTDQRPNILADKLEAAASQCGQILVSFPMDDGQPGTVLLVDILRSAAVARRRTTAVVENAYGALWHGLDALPDEAQMARRLLLSLIDRKQQHTAVQHAIETFGDPKGNGDAPEA